MWLFTALMDSTVCVCVWGGGGQYLCVWDVDGEVEWSRNDDLHALTTFKLDRKYFGYL